MVIIDDITHDLDLLDDWLAGRGYGEEAGLVLRAMALINKQARENEKLRAALKECASDLEAEIRGRYTGGGGWNIHPALVKKFEQDMSTVRAAASALKETGE